MSSLNILKESMMLQLKLVSFQDHFIPDPDFCWSLTLRPNLTFK